MGFTIQLELKRECHSFTFSGASNFLTMAATARYIQVVLLLLIVGVILVHVNRIQKWGESKIPTGGDSANSIMNDFLVGTTMRNLAKQANESSSSSAESQSESVVSKTPKGDVESSSGNATIPEISDLYCIDMVKRCMRKVPQAEHFPQVDNNYKPTKPTLAMGAPVLKGGYRNQYMRFVGLVGHAITNQHDLLLPSIKWHEKNSYMVIPFQNLFDVQHWNSNSTILPKLVSYEASDHFQWNPNTTTFIGACPTVITWFSSPHRTSVYKFVHRANAPYTFGGGRSGQDGNLWDYYRQRDKFGFQIELPNGGGSMTLENLEREIARAMSPSTMVKAIMHKLRPEKPYMAIHPRVEPEMMNHVHCQGDKVRDFPKIMNFAKKHPDLMHLDSMFVAIAMPQMKEKQPNKWQHAQQHKKNLELMETSFKEGTDRQDGSHIDVWTAGEAALEALHVPNCMLTTLASVINMELAIEADVFVGTSISTWSTSVWKIRHYLGKPNYEISHYGLKKVDGLPGAFKC